jgi:uncharacterized protein with FMN-binding domain
MGDEEEKMKSQNLRLFWLLIFLGCAVVSAQDKIGGEATVEPEAATESKAVNDKILSDRKNKTIVPAGVHGITEERKTASEVYIDGNYIGESPGWTGMRVEVVVKRGKIDKIQVLQVKGSPNFYQPVLKKMPPKMIACGNPEVDGVTGATLSSQSLKEAVRMVL